jgi:hypothetical protein
MIICLNHAERCDKVREDIMIVENELDFALLAVEGF